MSGNLNPARALIFRLTHRKNLAWILDEGVHCQNSEVMDPNFVGVGSPELIVKRQQRQVPIRPGGVLPDYVPFYFTPFSPMMYNINTGWGGIERRLNEELVILVSNLYTLAKMGRQFVFTDRHAYLKAAKFYSDLDDLQNIDWGILQDKDFERDKEDPGKVERYQAEALIYRHLPVTALEGIVCYTSAIQKVLHALMLERQLKLKIVAKPGWYFS